MFDALGALTIVLGLISFIYKVFRDYDKRLKTKDKEIEELKNKNNLETIKEIQKNNEIFSEKIECIIQKLDKLNDLEIRIIKLENKINRRKK